eukprot:2491658-Ditylum_brightwellii.AAC.1
MAAEAASSIMLGLTKAQTTTFFVSPKLMGMVKETLLELGKEGIKEAMDLAEINKDMWKQAADNLKHPGGWMKNPDKNSLKDSTVPHTPCIFGAKTQ